MQNRKDFTRKRQNLKQKKKIKLYLSYLWIIIDAIAAIYSEIHVQLQTNDMHVKQLQPLSDNFGLSG